ncbi:tRNA (cytidine(34)-2'-O)-methyltransferase [Sphingobium jiangsuense]|nr:tRNA (cytidine(34)-2'-O)-methyltransferase [Sphingobium jiangsuense]
MTKLLAAGIRCPMHLALYQPDIAGNVGTIIRLAACFSVPLDIVMPCGFPFSDKQLKRAAMDYEGGASLTRHPNADAFFAARAQAGSRIVLLTSHGDTALPDMDFEAGDTLLLGSEGAGVPADVHDRAHRRVRIPMAAGFRSLNIAVAAGIALSEALRQTGQYPR